MKNAVRDTAAKKNKKLIESVDENKIDSYLTLSLILNKSEAASKIWAKNYMPELAERLKYTKNFG